MTVKTMDPTTTTTSSANTRLLGSDLFKPGDIVKLVINLFPWSKGTVGMVLGHNTAISHVRNEQIYNVLIGERMVEVWFHEIEKV